MPALSTIGWIVLTITLTSMTGLAGGILPTSFVRRNISLLLAFAAGTLLAVAFLDMLPSSLEILLERFPHNHMHAITLTLATTALGFVLFYLIESFLGSHAAGQSGHKHDAVGPLILLGDAVHNMTDGIAIAAAFAGGTRFGIVTAIAVIVHELPQEIGDYAILIKHGYSRKKALLSLALVQTSAFLGAGLGIWSAAMLEGSIAYLLSATAGGFIYVAAADLLPELRREKTKGAARKVAAFLAGVGVILLMGSLLHHHHH